MKAITNNRHLLAHHKHQTLFLRPNAHGILSYKRNLRSVEIWLSDFRLLGAHRSVQRDYLEYVLHWFERSAGLVIVLVRLSIKVLQVLVPLDVMFRLRSSTNEHWFLVLLSCLPRD